MRVRWTETAQAHLASIHSYVALDSPAYAIRLVDCLTRRSQQIASYPHSGRRVPEYDMEMIREVIEGSYRIIYLIGADRIDVLAVIHGAQELDSELPNN
ncbi:MAG: type II toxin-antitoxin system RelE/ParE family toxin [Candidatus Sumerlaeaceae bacterium]|nr:type II toxin-antitoxin system RelE/ParE family toxin [Candidatus Sumerlaeaceae bacterium]